MADPLADLGFEEEAELTAALGFEEEPQPVSPVRREPVLGPKADAASLAGVAALPGGGLFTDLVSAGLSRAMRPDGLVDPAFAAAYPHIAAAAPLLGLIERGVRTGNPRESPGVRFTEEGEEAMRAQGTPIERAAPRHMIEDYRETRDTRREREAQGRRDEPAAAKAGATAALLASVFARGAPAVSLGGNTIPGRVASGAATGALYGGGAAAADGEADLTRGEVSRAAKDVGTGALGGLVLGGAASGAVEAARPLLVNPLRRLAVRQGKQAVTGQSDPMSGATRPLSDDAVEEVLASGGIRPLDTTQAVASRIETMAAEQGNEYGALLRALEERGVQGPVAARIAGQASREAAAIRDASMRADPRARTLRSEAEHIGQRAETVIPGDEPARASDLLRRLSLSNAEGMKRSAQDLAKFNRINASPREEVYQSLSQQLREGIEQSVEEAGRAAGPGSEVAALSARFVPVKQRTARLLEARHHALPGAAKAEKRSPVGLKDMLFGMTTGEPISTLALATGSSAARNRLPSTVAANAYGLSEGLRTGTASPELARILSLLYDDDVRDTTTTALIEALRNRKDSP